MSVLGAQVLALGTFLDAALLQLATLQRVEVTRSFRKDIEDSMSCMDDVALTIEYYSTLHQDRGMR
jgi:hypothetical protein